MKPKILIGGIGNIFKGDDGFGVEVVQRLARKITDPAVEVVDFGIRGFDLAYSLLDSNHDFVILVDVVKRGGMPGTIYLIEPDSEKLATQSVVAETHGMHPGRVLSWVSAMGGKLAPIRLVACEPAELGTDEDLKLGLSDPVQAAIEPAVATVEKLVREVLCTS